MDPIPRPRAPSRSPSAARASLFEAIAQARPIAIDVRELEPSHALAILAEGGQSHAVEVTSRALQVLVEVGGGLIVGARASTRDGELQGLAAYSQLRGLTEGTMRVSPLRFGTLANLLMPIHALPDVASGLVRLDDPTEQVDLQAALGPQEADDAARWAPRDLDPIEAIAPEAESGELAVSIELELPPEPMRAPAIPRAALPNPAAPITAAPISAAPITAAPITAAPITAKPISAEPISAEPITARGVAARGVAARPSPTAPTPRARIAPEAIAIETASPPATRPDTAPAPSVIVEMSSPPRRRLPRAFLPIAVASSLVGVLCAAGLFWMSQRDELVATPTEINPAPVVSTRTAAPVDEASEDAERRNDTARARSLARQARQALRRGDRDRAVSLARQAVRLRRGVAAYHTVLGDALSARGERAAARRAYRRALRLRPRYAPAQRGLRRTDRATPESAS